MEENPYENQVEFALRYGELDEMPGQKKHSKWLGIGAIASVVLVGLISLFVVIRANNRIIISFDPDGGANIDDIVIDKGTSVTLPTTTRSGYNFEGWYRNGTKVSGDIVFTENTVLIARWLSVDAETFTITFDSNGGDKIESQTQECGTALMLPEAPKREGYSFVVWSDENEVPIIEGALLPCKDVKLVASWTKGAIKDTDGPEKITLDHETVDLTVGDTTILTAKIEPADVKNKTVIWASSDPEIISVDANGMITAHRIGEAVISVTALNGKTANALVYSDVESVTIKMSSSLEYISNYGDLDTQNSVSFTVSTFPSIALEDDEFVWEATNSSGVTAVAELEAVGNSATLTAKNVGSGSEVVPVEVTASVGRTSSKTITVYVEPQLILNGETRVMTGKELTVTASTAVSEWSVRAKEGATKMTFDSIEREERKITVKPLLNKEDPNTHQAIMSSDLVITAITRAGQKVDFTATCYKTN